MKKFTACLLAALCICFSLLPAAAEGTASAVVTLRSDIAGVDYTTPERIAVIESDSIVFNPDAFLSCIQINDCVGNIILEPLKAGRTYVVCLSFIAADGYTLPDELTEENFRIEGSDNCNVFICHKAFSGYREGALRDECIEVEAEITVDGNLFQRIIGKILDILLKIRSWSPY